MDVVPISTAPGVARRIEDEPHAWQLVTGGVDWPWRRSWEYLETIAQV